ncbi:efflux RND transporter periplasmic adaptor subunit [Clostridium sp. KNHs214]|uniref:efflux RND transporter periplasmic adaptor subunit n=1 Tax=Clostridium sp. KNHs214 TaxID=1540257 RepID=UPI00054F3133|nr:efflux RND transporter periplasmic adaptor subunit [Clostridium sp. KNHs214]
MSKKISKIVFISVVVIIIAVAGWWIFNKYSKGKKVSVNTKYITATAAKRDIKVSVQGTGTVFADVTKEIVTNNNGEIKDLTVKVGDRVKKGQVICRVESEQLRQQISNAEINLQKQKLQLEKAKTDEEINLQNLLVNEAQKDLDYANSQMNKAVLTSPIDGVVVEKNNNSGDDVQSGKTIISIMDPTSLKIKSSIDELDISKVKKDQKVQISASAVEDKVYEGVVDFISETGTNNNNVTKYDVIISMKNYEELKIGMNVNVDILVNSKQDALVVPAEALIEKNGKKYIMTADSNNINSSDDSNNKNTNNDNKVNTNETEANRKNQNNVSSKEKQSGQISNRTNRKSEISSYDNLVEVKTGLENENYIEILEGINAGQKILIALPESNNTNTTNMRSNFGGMGNRMEMPGMTNERPSKSSSGKR